MVVIGVTGGVGTGKTTVAKIFAQLGASVLDADAIAHRLMEPKRLAWRRIVAAFGEGILNADQTINRRKLAAVVFADPVNPAPRAKARGFGESPLGDSPSSPHSPPPFEKGRGSSAGLPWGGVKRRRLEQIVHPQVFRQMKRQLHVLRRRRGVPAAVLDIPLLVEAGAREMVDTLVVVTAPPEVQWRRVAKRFDNNQEEFNARTAAQIDLEAKAALADYVVDNANGVEHTRRQVKAIWQLLRPRQ